MGSRNDLRQDATLVHLEPLTMEGTDVVAVVGRFGIYHGILLLLACLRAFPVAWTNMMSPLMAADLDHWCAAPNASIDAVWWKQNGIPKSPQGHPEECIMYSWSADGGIDNSKTVQCSNGWEYDTGNYGDTATAEWNLVCGDAWKRSAMQSIIMAGSFIGVLTFGKLSDGIGRKKSFICALALLMITGLSASIIQNFWIFNIFRLIMASSTTGVTAALVTMFMEIMPEKDRILMNIGFGAGYAFPVLFIPLLSYLLSSFRYMQLAIGLSGFLLVPFIWCTFESPKWLLAKNRLDDAEYSIVKILKINKRPLPNMAATMSELALNAERVSAARSNDLGFVDILKIPTLRRNAILLGLMWFMAAGKNYYLALNAHRLPGNPHINFAISTFSEFPAAIVGMVMIRKCRRLPSQIASSVLGTLLFTAVFFASDDNQFLKVWGSMVVRMFFIILVYHHWVAVHEIYPTPARGAGFALAMMCSRFGAMLAPFIKDVAVLTHYTFPWFMFILFIIIELFCINALPETLNQRLPDTVEDVDELLRLTKGKRKHNHLAAT